MDYLQGEQAITHHAGPVRIGWCYRLKIQQTEELDDLTVSALGVRSRMLGNISRSSDGWNGGISSSSVLRKARLGVAPSCRYDILINAPPGPLLCGYGLGLQTYT
jgi:hypothetical protein